MLVMTLYFVVNDIFVWVLAFISFWIPFTSAFYMLFGDRQVCLDDTCANKSVIENMDSYNHAMFGLYIVTFGTDLNMQV